MKPENMILHMEVFCVGKLTGVDPFNYLSIKEIFLATISFIVLSKVVPKLKFLLIIAALLYLQFQISYCDQTCQDDRRACTDLNSQVMRRHHN